MQVAGDQLARGNGSPGSAALDLGRQGERGLERGDGVARLEFFPEADDGVGHEQDQDDGEVRPVADDGGQDHRRLDHPGDRPPEVREELQQQVDLLVGQLVVAVLRPLLLDLGVAEAVRGRRRQIAEFRSGVVGRLRVAPRWGLRRLRLAHSVHSCGLLQLEGGPVGRRYREAEPSIFTARTTSTGTHIIFLSVLSMRKPAVSRDWRTKIGRQSTRLGKCR